MFHENLELLPPGDSSGLSLGNYEPTEGIALVHVEGSIINQLFWVEVSNED